MVLLRAREIVRDANNPKWAEEILNAVGRVTWQVGYCNGKAVDTIILLPIMIHTR